MSSLVTLVENIVRISRHTDKRRWKPNPAMHCRRSA